MRINELPDYEQFLNNSNVCFFSEAKQAKNKTQTAQQQQPSREKM